MSDDDEKWFNAVGQVCHEAANNPQPCIKLKPLEPDELKEHSPFYGTRRNRKNSYFVIDLHTTLTDEDLQYQIYDPSDILNQKEKMISKKNTKFM